MTHSSPAQSQFDGYRTPPADRAGVLLHGVFDVDLPLGEAGHRLLNTDATLQAGQGSAETEMNPETE